jgi:hypothetical protein
MIEGGRPGRVLARVHPVMVGHGTVHSVDDGLLLDWQERLPDRTLPPFDAHVGDVDRFRHGSPLTVGVPLY